MDKLLAFAPAVAALLALGGCATKGDIDQLRSQIAAVDAKATQAQAQAQQAAAAAQANARPAGPRADQAYRRSLQK